MAILEILTFPDPRLRDIAQPITKVTDDQRHLAKDMTETMYHYRGIGLAATQVGQAIRLIIVDTSPSPDAEDLENQGAVKGKKAGKGTDRDDDDEDDDSENRQTELEKKIKFPLVLFNPIIKKAEGKTSYDEGCLSVPGFYETVQRQNIIQVEALDIQGRAVRFEVDGLTAICIQHEIDHLEGKLFIDRLSFMKSRKIKEKIKKSGYPPKKEAPKRRRREKVEV